MISEKGPTCHFDRRCRSQHTSKCDTPLYIDPGHYHPLHLVIHTLYYKEQLQNVTDHHVTASYVYRYIAT